MVKGKRVKKRSHSSEEESTLRDLHEQESGEGSAPTRSGDEEQGSAAAAPQVRYTLPPRPRSRLYNSPVARPVSTVDYHRQLTGRLYEMDMDDVLNRRR